MELRAVVDLYRRANESLLVTDARNSWEHTFHVELLGTHAEPVVPAGRCEVGERNVPYQLVTTTVEE